MCCSKQKKRRGIHGDSCTVTIPPSAEIVRVKIRRDRKHGGRFTVTIVGTKLATIHDESEDELTQVGH